MSTAVQNVENTVQSVETIEKNIADNVLNRIKVLKQAGQIQLPKDYSVENALKAAYFCLMDVKTSNKEPVLEACTKSSIANSLLEMVVSGLNVSKKQGYFIAYGKNLKFQTSYMGDIALAKRFGGVVKVTANVIYRDDEFEFEIDAENGLKRIMKHKQSLNSLNSEIAGAYAILTLEDGSKYIEIMSTEQIKNSWNRGQTKGNSTAHKDHPEEMSKRTVIRRACKLFLNTSDDAALFYEDEYSGSNENVLTDNIVKLEIEENANQEIIDFNDAQIHDVESDKNDTEIIEIPEQQEVYEEF